MKMAGPALLLLAPLNLQWGALYKILIYTYCENELFNKTKKQISGPYLKPKASPDSLS
jgi:hypothetical protein